MKSTLPIALFFIIFGANAGVERDIILDKTIKNTDCKKNDSCTLKEFTLQITDYIVTSQSQKSYGTKAIFAYETKDIKDIEDYAVVQFIRGCVYNEDMDENGKLHKRKGITRKFFGSYHKFIHPEWVIDSIDKDPIYNSSDVTSSRHDYYRWNENPDSYSDVGEEYLLREQPSYPKVYVSDLPSTSFYSHSSAKNTNLEFKVCIYKTKDIPLELGPKDINFAEPIQCMNWKTSNVYNFKKGIFETDVSISKSCDDL